MKILTKAILALAAALSLPGAARADYTVTQGSGATVLAFVCAVTKICPAQVLIDSTGAEKGTVVNPVVVSGTNFTPNSGTPLVLTAGGTSQSGAIPTGTPTTVTVKITNLGTVPISVAYGIGSATAVVNQDIVQPGGQVFRAVGTYTWIAVLDQTGTTSNTVVVQSGTGTGADTGGNPPSQSNLGTSPGAVPVPSGNEYTVGSLNFATIGVAFSNTIAALIAVNDGAGNAIVPTALATGAPGAPPGGSSVVSVQPPWTQTTAIATGTTGAVTATLAANLTKTNYICGFDVSAIGGTAAVSPITVTGLLGGTFTYQGVISAVAGVNFGRQFSQCIPASGVNVGIAVITTADGTASAVDVQAWGYVQ